MAKENKKSKLCKHKRYTKAFTEPRTGMGKAYILPELLTTDPLNDDSQKNDDNEPKL